MLRRLTSLALAGALLHGSVACAAGPVSVSIAGGGGALVAPVVPSPAFSLSGAPAQAFHVRFSGTRAPRFLAPRKAGPLDAVMEGPAAEPPLDAVGLPGLYVAAPVQVRTTARIGAAFQSLPFAASRFEFEPLTPGDPLESGWRPLPPPAKPGPDPKARQRASLRAILRGTASYKLGMDSMAVAVPLALHSATWVAVFMAVWNLSQAVASSSADLFLRRWAPETVLRGALAAQCLAVAGMFGLMSAHLFGPLVLPFYAAAGMSQGVIETARRVLPRSVLGPDRGPIEAFNSRTHMSYEVAGVIGAVGAGLAISTLGLGAALALHPFAYAAASLFFRRVHSEFRWEPEQPQARPPAGLRGWWRAQWSAGARLWKDPALRGLSLALLLPQVIHRILEGFALPLYAKDILRQPAHAGWLLGASNAGELMGALLLLKLALARNSPSAAWVRLTAVATLGLWLTAFSSPWMAVLPLIALQSTAWAASDLKLSSKFQSRADVTPREVGFLFAAYLTAVTGVTLGLGALFDAVGPGSGFIALNVLLTAAAAWLYLKNG